MNLSAPFIYRPIGTWLLTLGLMLAGTVAFFLLPVAPLPQVDYPTISISANLPGASPETMAATVATPLERALGTIAGVTELTSTSSLGSTRITLQLDLDQNIETAAKSVQAALNATRAQLPSGMLRRYCPLAPAAEKLLRGAFERMGYSARAYDRILRVARTIADMNGVEQIGAAELMEALQYRRMDRAVGK